MLRQFIHIFPRNNSRQFHNNVKTVRNIRNNLTSLKTSQIRFLQQKPLKCWQCGIQRKNIAELFCEQCHHIQGPSDKSNYFKLFNLDEKYDIDVKTLRNKYRQMQSVLHPDKFSNKSSEEKDISEEYSSLVNKAYNILQNDLKRAVHLLNLKGGKIEENQKGDDPDFLMEIMELNEQVENANSDEKLLKLNKNNIEKLMDISRDIKEAFQHDQIDFVKQLIVKMRFYKSVYNHINDLMREKGIVK